MPRVFKFSCAFCCGPPSFSLCLLILFPLGFLLCAPPPRYHTWPSPYSLSSPVPHLFISDYVFRLCLPFTPCPVIVFHLPLSASMLLFMRLLLYVPSSPWYAFWT